MFAFLNTSLKSIVLPESLNEIGFGAFNCSDLKTAGPATGNFDVKFNWKTEIPGCAFSEFSYLVSIEIPEGVTDIGDNLASDLAQLEKLILPASVQSVSKGLQSGEESKLETAGPIGSGCNIEFGWTTTIPDYAFAGCSALKSVALPENLVSIGQSVFSGNINLQNIMLPDTVTSIGEHAFDSCKQMTEITIPDGVTTIEPYTFDNCAALETVIIPDGVKTIGKYAFYNCISLNTAELPKNITEINDYAFSLNTALDSVTLPEGLRKIGKYAFSCIKAEEVIIPTTIQEIGERAFCNSSLTNVVFRDGSQSVTIAERAFEGTALVSVTLSSNIVKLGNSGLGSNAIKDSNGAFYNCNKMKDVYYTGTEAEWKKKTFSWSFTYAGVTLHFLGISHLTDPSSSDGERFFIGTVDAVSEKNITIDGTVYQLDNALGQFASNTSRYVGKEVQYKLNESLSVCSMALPQQALITISAWNGTTGVLTDAESRLYRTARTTDTTFLADIDEHMNKQAWITYFPGTVVAEGNGASAVLGSVLMKLEYCNATVGTLDKFDMESLTVDGVSYKKTSGFSGTLTEKMLGQPYVLVYSDTIAMAGYDRDSVVEIKTTARQSQAPAYTGGKYDSSGMDFTCNVTYDFRSDYRGPKEIVTKSNLFRNADVDITLTTNAPMLDLSDNSVLISMTLGKTHTFTFHGIVNGKTSGMADGVKWDIKNAESVDCKASYTIREGYAGRTFEKVREYAFTIVNTDLVEKNQQEYEASIKSEAEKAAKAAKIINSSITLPEIELGQYLDGYNNREKKFIMDAAKTTIYYEMSMLKMKPSMFSKMDATSAKVLKKIMIKYLGSWEPSVSTSHYDFPAIIQIPDKSGRNQTITFEFDCSLDSYELSGTSYGVTGNIKCTVKVQPQGKTSKSYTLDSQGVIAKADMDAFSNATTSLALSTIKSAFGKLETSKGLNEYGNVIYTDSINALSEKMAGHVFQKPVTMILEKIYEKELKDKTYSNLFAIMAWPAKHVSVHCPVDVYVYNAADELVLYTDGEDVIRVKEDDSVSAWTEGDAKYFVLYDDQYHLEYIATGEGEMNIKIEESAGGEVVTRTVAIEKVPLTDSIQYAEPIPENGTTAADGYKLYSLLGDIQNATGETNTLDKVEMDSYTIGDVNDDGKVNVVDAYLLRCHAAQLKMLDSTQQVAADVNGDGKINVVDSYLIRCYAAQLINEFPAA